MLASWHAVRWPLHRPEFDATAGRLGWRITRESEHSLGVDAGLGVGPEEVTVIVGATGEAGLGELTAELVENPMVDTAEARAFLQDTFAGIAAVAIAALGAPTHRRLGDRPELRWRGETGTLTLCRTARRVNMRVQSTVMQDLEDSLEF